MRVRTAGWAGALMMGAVAATPAQAQINFYTQGYFTSSTYPGCTNVVPVAGAAVGNSCTTPAFTLAYTAKELNPGLIGSGSIVSLGNFSLTGTGDGTVSGGDLLFTLAIQQTDPTTGMGMTMGSVTGSVMTNDDFSSLIWVPGASSIVIDGTTYQLIFDDRGPAANRGVAIAINNETTPTSVNAIVETSAVPEPASMLLIATGLIGVFGAVRRQRRMSAPM